MRKLTPKPAATPANAAAIPASGLRPTLLNAAAPRGISTRYPASEAMLERTPMKMMIGVSIAADETATSLRMRAPISPAASARPTPIMTTRMIATAAKLRKFATKDVNRKRIPSADRRLWIEAVSSTIRYSPSCTDASGRPPDGCVEPPWTTSSTGTGGASATSKVTLMSAHERARRGRSRRHRARRRGSPGRASCSRRARSRRGCAPSGRASPRPGAGTRLRAAHALLPANASA